MTRRRSFMPLIPVIPYCQGTRTLRTSQLIPNGVSRKLTRMRQHSTSVLTSLHRLSVRYRIKFKIPSYIKELIEHSNLLRVLCSEGLWDLWVTRKVSGIRSGGRSFSYLAPLFGTNNPMLVQGADTVSFFNSGVKTFLCHSAHSQNPLTVSEEDLSLKATGWLFHCFFLSTWSTSQMRITVAMS